MAKIEAGKLLFRPEHVDLETLIGEVCNVQGALAAARGITLEIAVHDDASHAELDPLRLRQVLYNYLSNAIKFSDRGGRVVVRTKPHGTDMFCLEVQDDGVGIRREDAERLFTEFEQLAPRSTRRAAGTGLGLALTRKLVEAQVGSVGVRSDRETRKGATFFAVLPRRMARDQTGPQPGADASPRPGHPDSSPTTS
jgi:signal transduction histidine kinase